MAGTNDSDSVIAARLRSLYSQEIERASADASVFELGVRARNPSLSIGQVAMVVIAVIGSVALFNAVIRGSATPQSARATPETGARPSPVVAGPDTVLLAGLPMSIAGEYVFVGDGAIDAIESSTNDQPVLLGGWLRGEAFACPALTDPWQPCSALRLYRSAADRRFVPVYPLGDISGPPSLDDGAAVGVVVRAHTHDASCYARDICAKLAVFESVVWVGRTTTPTLPAATPPPTHVSSDAAAAAAVSLARTQGDSSPEIVAVIARRYGELGFGGLSVSDDHWLWVVTMTGNLQPPCPDEVAADCPSADQSELVVIDYTDGQLLLAALPAPPAP